MTLRRELTLPPGDVEYLDSSHEGWEVLRVGATTWLVLPNFSVPGAYEQALVTVALRIEPGYPDTQIDMVYFSPGLKRADGIAIPATESHETIDGRSFQRWSRHRTAQNPWRAGEDDVQTHMLLVKHWLERELVKCVT